jgi:hypothetical protein
MAASRDVEAQDVASSRSSASGIAKPGQGRRMSGVSRLTGVSPGRGFCGELGVAIRLSIGTEHDGPVEPMDGGWPCSAPIGNEAGCVHEWVVVIYRAIGRRRQCRAFWLFLINFQYLTRVAFAPCSGRNRRNQALPMLPSVVKLRLVVELPSRGWCFPVSKMHLSFRLWCWLRIDAREINKCPKAPKADSHNSAPAPSQKGKIGVSALHTRPQGSRGGVLGST